MSHKSSYLKSFAIPTIGSALLLLFALNGIAIGEAVELKTPQPKADECVELLPLPA